jgi:uncharacterized caspase-like protein
MSNKKWALLIGIDDYERVSRLSFARADVNAFGEALKTYCDFDEVQVLTDEGKGKMQTTHNGIIGALETLSYSIKPGDTFLFYFAGHGIVRKEESYLLGVNADITSIRRTAMTSVPLAMIKDTLQDIPAIKKVLIFDACRNEPALGRNSEANILNEKMWEGFRDIIVSRRPDTGGSGNPTAAVLFACDIGQRA